MNRTDMKKELQVPSSKREAADPVDPSAIDEDMEETGPAEKVRRGHKEPSGRAPMAGGSIIGSGEDAEFEPGETTMSSSSRDKTPTPGGSIIGSGHGNGVPFKGPKSFTK